MSDVMELADRFFEAITRGDADALRKLYAPDAKIWHNNDGLEQGVDQNLQVLAWIAANVRDFRYEEIRREPTSSGFVQQHVLRGVAPNGEKLEIPACIVFTVRGGQVTRVEEYLDTAHVQPLLAG